MSEPLVKPHPFVALRINHKDTYDAIAMFVYLILVYGWGLWLYPLGRDYHHLANHGADMAFLPRHLFAAEMRIFGANPVGYHLVNIALMYACMVLTYHFVNLTIRGLWWFGSLAACLFMANPVHSEAMLNLSGVADLVPCLAGLITLTVYAWHASAQRTKRSLIVVAVAIGVGGLFAENIALGFVLLAYEFLAVRKQFRQPRRAVFAAVMFVLLGHMVRPAVPFNFAQMLAPLYLVFYPIGFLPKTVEAFHDRPWTAWLAAIAIVVIIGLIHRKAQRPIFLFAAIGMLLLRVLPGHTPVDLVHMIGGGQMLLPNVLFVLGLIAIVFRVMDHPRWRVPMISITTTLVIILFAMQWRVIWNWHNAGDYVREFQSQAAKSAAGSEPIGVLPDYRYYRGAPLCLSESITFDTPFGKPVPHAPLLPLHLPSLAKQEVSIQSWDKNGGEVWIAANEDESRYAHFPDAQSVPLGVGVNMKDVWGESMPNATITVTRGANHQFQVNIAGKKLPLALVPGNAARKEPNGETKSDADHQ